LAYFIHNIQQCILLQNLMAQTNSQINPAQCTAGWHSGTHVLEGFECHHVQLTNTVLSYESVIVKLYLK